MPELPEVEIAARNLRTWALGRTIREVETDRRAVRIFRPASSSAFAAGLRGARVDGVLRLGKHLLVTLRSAGGVPLGLLSHLGMTGKWLCRAPGEEEPAYTRARLLLDDGRTLHYRDPRLFGRLRLVPGARFHEIAEVAALGPDPLEEGIDLDRLARAFARRRGPVKIALLDQALLPGVGNILASEALHRARVDPRRSAAALTRRELGRLRDGLLETVRESIARDEGPEIAYVEEPGTENPFLVYAREGEPCPRCKTVSIRRLVQAQRSTFYCPRCQRPRPAARPRR